MRGLENLALWEINDGTRAPTNSMRENDETELFTKALQKTERNKTVQNTQQQQKPSRV